MPFFTTNFVEQRIKKKHPELINEWLELTTEYTPDDRIGPLCYVSSYAETHPEEDRAETLAKFYEMVFIEKDTSLFLNEVLKKKALHWDKMIRKTFALKNKTNGMS